ncbi:hypothetical protein COOONC_01635 [Cooperia oncophora]
MPLKQMIGNGCYRYAKYSKKITSFESSKPVLSRDPMSKGMQSHQYVLLPETWMLGGIALIVLVVVLFLFILRTQPKTRDTQMWAIYIENQ